MKNLLGNSKAVNYGSWLLLFVGLVVGSFLLTDQPSSSSNRLDQVETTPVSAASGIEANVGHIPIEDIKVGMRVMARNPEISDQERSTWVEPNWEEWFHLSLVMPKPDGAELKIEMLRSEDWIRSQLGYVVGIPEQPVGTAGSTTSFGKENVVPDPSLADSEYVFARRCYLLRPLFQDMAEDAVQLSAAGANIEGLTIQLDLPELGLTGDAYVENIKPCPHVFSGSGKVVTAMFHHTAGNVIDLNIENADGTRETIGTTSNHPFWSEDRQEFVQAGELKHSEKLIDASGKVQTVDELIPHETAPVYNFEVHNEHVYFVGDSGTLVHNAYPVQTPHGIRWKDEITGLFVKFVKAPNRGAALRAKYGHLTPAQRQAQIAELSEANYGRRIQEIESNFGASNVHGLDRHGAQTTLLGQLRRVSQSSYPSPTSGLPTTATKTAGRFLTNRDHFEALTFALRQPIPASGFHKVHVPFSRSVGEQVINLGTHGNRGPFTVIRGLQNAEVRFNNGRVVSAFPTN